jgi:hypothetical protein
MHRPVPTRSLLWAKVAVLAEVSIWLGMAFNLCGLFVGATAPDGHWWYLPVHALSTALEAFFCTGCVVLSYQLCLRWFGRERLEGMMTLAQIAVSVGAMLISQVVPQFAQYSSKALGSGEGMSLWILLLPPVWFAGLDDALAGSHARSSWALAVLGLVATVIVLWLAFGKLVASYETGLQVLNESRARRSTNGGRRRLLDRLLDAPPLKWWIRDPSERAAFLLAAAYLIRDRDVKLRIYPSVAPFLMMPVIFLLQDITRGPKGPSSGLGPAFAGGYSGMIPMMAIGLMQYSQHWRAADVFRTAPLPGPAALCRGTRKAVMLLIVVPVVLAMIGLTQLIRPDLQRLWIMVPGLLLLPVLALLPDLRGSDCLLSKPPEDAKSASRGSVMMGAIMVSMLLSGLAIFASATGWLAWLIVAEGVVVAMVYVAMERSLRRAAWSSAE